MGPLPRGMFNPVVGSGAQYEIQPNGKDKMNIEIDVVGKESVNGKDGYWFETAFDSHMGQMLMKMLTVSDAAELHSRKDDHANAGRSANGDAGPDDGPKGPANLRPSR